MAEALFAQSDRVDDDAPDVGGESEDPSSEGSQAYQSLSDARAERHCRRCRA